MEIIEVGKPKLRKFDISKYPKEKLKPRRRVINVKLMDDDGNIEEREYIYIGEQELEEVYQEIKDRWPINLSRCFIYNFSLEEYRRKYDIKKKEQIVEHVELKDFNAKFSIFKEDVDFASAIFSGDAYFSDATFNGDASFNSATFDGYTYFSTTKFRGNAFFISTTFKGDAYFGPTSFNVNAFFNSATFKGDVSFHSVTFNEEADFSKVKFYRKTCFIKATFNKDASFIKTTFKGEATFPRATFNKETDFRFAKFREDVNFLESKFEGDAKFMNVTFNKEANFPETIFLKRAYFYEINKDIKINNMQNTEIYFFNSHFSKSAHFNDSKLGKSNFHNTYFEYPTDFSNTVFIEAEFAGTVFKEYGQFKDVKIDKGTRETFRVIKNELIKTNNNIDAIDISKREMEALFKEKLKIWYKRFPHLFVLGLNWLSNGYGTRWWQAVLFTLAMTFIFSVFYISFGLNEILDFQNHKFSRVFFDYLSIGRGLTMENDENVSFLGKAINYLGRVVVIYGYYQILQAFRKFKLR